MRLGQLAQMAVQVIIDNKQISSESVPNRNVSKPLMKDIAISEKEVLKLLDFNPHKACGPDKLKPLGLRQLACTMSYDMKIVKVICDLMPIFGKITYT